MNYENIKSIMAYLLGKVTCPHCKTAYKDNGLHVLDISAASCFVVGICPKCSNPSLIEVNILSDIKSVKEAQIKIKTRQHRAITENEVLDIHNFLKGFNGDFKKLFTNVQ